MYHGAGSASLSSASFKVALGAGGSCRVICTCQAMPDGYAALFPPFLPALFSCLRMYHSDRPLVHQGDWHTKANEGASLSQHLHPLPRLWSTQERTYRHHFHQSKKMRRRVSSFTQRQHMEQMKAPGKRAEFQLYAIPFLDRNELSERVKDDMDNWDS